MSAPYLSGASIDYLDTLEKSGFTIDNPNAAGSLRLRRVVPLTASPGSATPPWAAMPSATPRPRPVVLIASTTLIERW